MNEQETKLRDDLFNEAENLVLKRAALFRRTGLPLDDLFLSNLANVCFRKGLMAGKIIYSKTVEEDSNA